MAPMKDGDCTDDAPDPPRPRQPGEKPRCGSLQMLTENGIRTLTYAKTTLADFARSLSQGMDRYVLDRTGVVGDFILRLAYAPDDSMQSGVFNPPVRGEPSADDPAGVSIHTALQEQLGLKLESVRGPREVLVIDHVERPSPNSVAAIVDRSPRGRSGR